MNRSFVKYFVLCFLFCTRTIFSQTKNQIDTSGQQSYQFEDIVVTAQYAPSTTNKSAYKIRVIDSAKVQALAAVNLKDALSNELNIRVNNDPILGSGMSLQGLGGQNVKILIDGVAVIGRQNGNIDLSQINLANVDRIEIVEGPLAVNYGTDALAGVINIIMKKPKQAGMGLESTLYYESNNTYNFGISGNCKKKNHGLSASFNRNYFNGWSSGEPYYFLPKETLADTGRTKSWKPKEQFFGDLQYMYQKGKFKINYRSAAFHEQIFNRGYPLKPYYESAFDDYYKTLRLDNSASLDLKLKNFNSFNTTIAYNYFKRTKTTVFKDLVDLSEELAADPTLQDTSIFMQGMARGSFVNTKPYITWEDTIQKKNKFNYDIGYDLNYNYAYGKRIATGSQVIGDYALFSTCEFQPFKNFIFRPGLRVAYNTVYKTPLIPSLNIKYNNELWSYRVSYAKGFRAPDLKELYFEFVDVNHQIFGNPELKPETSDNFNLNAKYNGGSVDRKITTDISGFYNQIENLITLAMTGSGRYSYINVGEFKSFGASVNSSCSFKALTISGGASLIYRYNILSEDDPSVEEYSPTTECRASLQYKFSKWKTVINCFYKYNGRMQGYALDSEDKVFQTKMEDYHMLDMNVSQPFFKNTLNVSVGFKNLLNVNNVTASMAGGAHSGNSTSTAIAMGRTIFIKLTYAFKK